MPIAFSFSLETVIDTLFRVACAIGCKSLKYNFFYVPFSYDKLWGIECSYYARDGISLCLHILQTDDEKTENKQSEFIHRNHRSDCEEIKCKKRTIGIHCALFWVCFPFVISLRKFMSWYKVYLTAFLTHLLYGMHNSGQIERFIYFRMDVFFKDNSLMAMVGFVF